MVMLSVIGFIHIATLTNLDNGKRVYYTFGDPKTKMSDVLLRLHSILITT